MTSIGVRYSFTHLSVLQRSDVKMLQALQFVEQRGRFQISFPTSHFQNFTLLSHSS